MKKNKLIILVLIVVNIVLTMLVGVQFFEVEHIPEVKEFDLRVYWYEMEKFHVEREIGAIDSEEKAIIISKALWIERFPSEYDKNEIKNRIEVQYDSNYDCWHIQTRPVKKYTFGGSLHALIGAYGDILAVWIDV